MSSSNLVRWGGLAAVLGGVMWVIKGGVIILGGPDPNLFILAQPFFALGLLGLYARLAGHGGWPRKVGGLLAYVALALSTVNAPYSLFAEDGPQTPFPFNATYFAASLAIFMGLVLVGAATLRTGTLPPRWRILPLVIGLSALLPIWVLALVHLELPVVLLGLGWMLLGYLLWSGRSDPVRRTAPVS